MNQPLREIYVATLIKYKKYKTRLDNGQQSGRFYSLSQKKQNRLIARVQRLWDRLKQLRWQLKMGLASGVLIAALNTNEVDAQQIGPFVANESVNPLRKPYIEGTNKKPALVDLDNDGDLDLIVGKEDGLLSYYENIGTASRAKYAGRTGVDNPFSGISLPSNAAPAFHDLDGDGDQDLVLGQFAYFGVDLVYYENQDDADGTIGNDPTFNLLFGAASPVNGVSGNNSHVHLSFVDIDNDGDMDIFTSNGGSLGSSPYYQSVLFYQNNSGTFTLQGSLPTGLGEFESDGSDRRLAINFSDLDQDGDFDVIFGINTGTLRYFENNDFDDDAIVGNSPNFTEQISATNPFDAITIEYNTVPVFADIDNDGDLDAIVGHGNGAVQNLGFLRNNAGSFEQVTGLNNPFDGLDVGQNVGGDDASPTFVDLNGDDLLDAVIGAEHGSELLYFENIGGEFEQKFNTDNPFSGLVAGSYNLNPDFADLDNDADLDLYMSRVTFSGPSNASLEYFDNSSGVFTIGPQPIGSNYYDVYAPTFADYDGDGDLDLALGTYGTQIQYYSNDDFDIDGIVGNAPNLNLISPATSPFSGITVDAYSKPTFTDLDHDGDYDVAIGIHQGVNNGQLRFLLNESGTLNEQLSTANPFNGIDVGDHSDPAFADLDQDGDLDLFVGDYNGQISFYENQNLAPEVRSSVTTRSFSEGGSRVFLDPAMEIWDDGNTSNLNNSNRDDLIGLTVSINNVLSTEDVLSFNSSVAPNITGSYSASSGVLTFSGNAAAAEYQSVLQTVYYDNTNNDNPSTSTRVIEIIPTDYDATDPTASGASILSINVAVTGINDAPTLVATSTGSVSYLENDNPVLIDSGISLGDVDNSTFESAAVTISSNFVSGEDELIFSDQNGISGSYDAISGTLSLTGTATIGQYQTALRSISYQNTSEEPNTLNRTVSFQINDGLANSNTDTRTIGVIEVNDAPEVSLSGTASTFTENATEINVDEAISVADVDSPNLTGATITISNFVSGEDELLFTDQNGITGTFDTVNGVLELSGTAAVSDYELALRSIAFLNNSETPNTDSRLIDIFVTDGIDNSTTVTQSITVESVNDSPVVSASGSISYTENSSAIPVDPGLSLVDIDSPELVEATLTIVNYIEGEDELLFTDQNGISGIFDSITGVLSLNGTATLANYQIALQSVFYINRSDNPDITPRNIEINVNDGGAANGVSNTESIQLDIVAVNDLPEINSVNAGSTVNYVKGIAAVLDEAIDVVDVDNDSFVSASISITDFNQGDVLSVNNTGSFEINYNTTSGVLSISGIDNEVNWESVLQSVTFETTNDDLQKSIEFVINDGTDDSQPFGVNVNISGNFPPVVDVIPQSTQSGNILTFNWCDLVNDPDNSDEDLIVSVSGILSGATASIEGCNVVVSYENISFDGEDTITIEACDPSGACDSNIVTIEVSPYSEAPELVIYNVVTPNGDGVHDYFKIGNIRYYEDNKVLIFDRWGGKVFEQEGYNNTSQTFIGVANIGSEKELDSGNYYYVIEKGDGTKALNGFLFLKR